MIKRVLFLAISVITLGVITLFSLKYGAKDISWETVYNAIFNFNDSIYPEYVVRTMRIPRVIIGLFVGAALGVSGSSMQVLTKNPLAGPSLMGINSGAAFFIVIAIFIFNITAPGYFMIFALVGGFITAAFVFLVSRVGSGGQTTYKLTLAGVVVTALMNSWMTGILIVDRQSMDIVRFWLTGSIGGRDIETFIGVLPFLIVGIAGNILMSGKLNIISLGEESAKGLGMRVGVVRFWVTLFVVLASSSAVAIAGPISFVGLAVPHIARAIGNGNYKWITIYSTILGPILLLTSDLLGRVLVRPQEIQVGIVTAIVGAPFIIFVARRRRVVSV